MVAARNFFLICLGLVPLSLPIAWTQSGRALFVIGIPIFQLLAAVFAGGIIAWLLRLNSCNYGLDWPLAALGAGVSLTCLVIAIAFDNEVLPDTYVGILALGFAAVSLASNCRSADLALTVGSLGTFALYLLVLLHIVHSIGHVPSWTGHQSIISGLAGIAVVLLIRLAQDKNSQPFGSTAVLVALASLASNLLLTYNRSLFIFDAAIACYAIVSATGIAHISIPFPSTLGKKRVVLVLLSALLLIAPAAFLNPIINTTVYKVMSIFYQKPTFPHAPLSRENIVQNWVKVVIERGRVFGPVDDPPVLSIDHLRLSCNRINCTEMIGESRSTNWEALQNELARQKIEESFLRYARGRQSQADGISSALRAYSISFLSVSSSSLSFDPSRAGVAMPHNAWIQIAAAGGYIFLALCAFAAVGIVLRVLGPIASGQCTIGALFGLIILIGWAIGIHFDSAQAPGYSGSLLFAVVALARRKKTMTHPTTQARL